MKVERKHKDNINYFSDLKNGDTFLINKTDETFEFLLKIEDCISEGVPANAVYLSDGELEYIDPFLSVYKLNCCCTIED